MISTFHGLLPLTVFPADGLELTAGGRVHLCKVRGEALGQVLNVEVTLDVNTGELLLFSPDGWVGAFRLGDLVASHVQASVARAMRERQEGEHAQAH